MAEETPPEPKTPEEYHTRLGEWIQKLIPDTGDVDPGDNYWAITKPKLLAMHKAQKKDFCLWPAGKFNHHWWEGGYAQHIYEVCFNVRLLCCGKFTNGLENFEPFEAFFVAYLHDLDKLERYEWDREEPSDKQCGYAYGALKIAKVPNETKSNLSSKIDNKLNGTPIRIYPFNMSKDYVNVEESGHVASILAKHGIYLPLKYLEPVGLHHGYWADLIQSRGNKIKMSELTIFVHLADMLSGKINGMYDPNGPYE